MRAIVLAGLLALSPSAAPARPATILFVGNSFTFAALSPVWKYRASSVTDLNRDGVGGVPALFKLFTQGSRARLPGVARDRGRAVARMALAHQTRGDRPAVGPCRAPGIQHHGPRPAWRPGEAGDLFRKTRGAGSQAQPEGERQPDRDLVARRPHLPRRPALVGPADHANGRRRPRGDDLARRGSPAIGRVHPVGEAFNCAIAAGIADANPYDGISFGQVDLWAYDQYHASTAGYYLEALVVFAGVTGRDPRELGRDETAANELGLSPDLAQRLQAVAWQMALGGGCNPAALKAGK